MDFKERTDVTFKLEFARVCGGQQSGPECGQNQRGKEIAHSVYFREPGTEKFNFL